jgi:hypothetical protein
MPEANASGSNGAGPLRRVSPLFRNPINEEGEYLYLDQIASIRISRQVTDSGNRTRRVPILDNEFEVDGNPDDTFFIDPSATREEDILAHFGLGDYYIEPIGTDGRVLKGGRVLPFAAARGSGGSRRGGRWGGGGGRRGYGPPQDPYDEDEPDEMPGPRLDPRADPSSPAYDPRCDNRFPSYDPRQDPRYTHLFANPMGQPGAAAAAPAIDPAMAKLIESQQDLARQLREQADKRAEDAQKWASFNNQGGIERAAARDDLVTELREELAELRRKNRDDLDELRRKSQDELQAKTRELEDQRREHLDKLRSLQDEFSAKRRELEESLRAKENDARRDLDAERRRHEDEMMETKRRLRNETDEEREKRHKSADEARMAVEKRFKDLEQSSAEARIRLERRIEELMKENIDLRRDLADTPPPGADQPPPIGPTGANHPEAPWWGPGALQAVAPIGQAIADIAKTAVADAAKKKSEEEKREREQQRQANGPPPSPTLPSDMGGTSSARSAAQSYPQQQAAPPQTQQAVPPPPQPSPPRPPSPPPPAQPAVATPAQSPPQPTPPVTRQQESMGSGFSLGASITHETAPPLRTPDVIVIDESVPAMTGPIPDPVPDDDEFAEEEEPEDDAVI